MKTKRKLLITSVASLMLLSTVVVGSTFALFTSKSETNISVTTGKVNVVAEATGLKTSSPTVIPESLEVTEYTDGTGEFVNGGSATLDGNKLTLSKLTPGDKVSFDLNVANESNVSIKYRVLLSETNPESATNDSKKLFSALKFKLTYGEGETATTKEYENIIQYQSAWTTLAAEGTMDNAHIEIELPVTAGNEYQGLSTSIKYVIEAVQGNAATEGEEFVEHYYLAESGSDIKAVASSLVSGETKTVRLDNNIGSSVTLDVVEGATLNIDLNDNQYGQTVTNSSYAMNIKGAGNVNVSNGRIAARSRSGSILLVEENVKATFTDCVFENTTTTASSSNVPSVAFITTTKNASGGYDPVTSEVSFDNCDFIMPSNLTTYGICTNGSQTNGAKISLTDCNIQAKYAIFFPGDCDYTLKNTNATGYTIICGGNTAIDGGTFKQTKASSVTKSPAGGNTDNVFSDAEAKTYLTGVSSGAGCLFDTITVIDNRSAAYNLRGFSIKNATVGVDAKTTAEDVIFGIRYINMEVAGEAITPVVENCTSLNDLTKLYSVDYFANPAA